VIVNVLIKLINRASPQLEDLNPSLFLTFFHSLIGLLMFMLQKMQGHVMLLLVLIHKEQKYLKKF